MSSDDWESEDDEQLSQSLSQLLSQQPAESLVPKQESDDSWASEDDEQLSQELLSQQNSEQKQKMPLKTDCYRHSIPRLQHSCAG